MKVKECLINMKNNKIVNVNIKQQTESYGKSKKNPKSAQDTLPWDEVYTNGIFRCGNNFSLRFLFSKLTIRQRKIVTKILPTISIKLFYPLSHLTLIIKSL